MHADKPEDRLARLTPAERAVLDLLAHGHTAKTIAAELGVSVAAVNERLRSARRRTGAGSSRELARLLAQENRDEFSGLPIRPDVAPAPVRAPLGRWSTRRNLMLAGSALAAMALSLSPYLADLNGQAPAASTGPDADIVASFEPSPDPRRMREQLRAEAVDAAWAAPTEARLRESYASIPNAEALELLSVACATTLCEVVGRTRAGAAPDSATAVMDDIQSLDLNTAVEGLGVRVRSSSFTSNPATREGVAFVIHLERRSGA